MKDTDQKNGAERVAREAGLDQAERLDMLRELFPEAFAEGKVDWDKLRAALGDGVDGSPERYNFTWAGKRDALRLAQTSTRATLLPAKDESESWDTTKNAFIEGDNLEVLKLLLKPYYGRVKMIYIDPPYNTGNDFVYPDNYADPLDTYLKLSGQKDDNGNLLTTNADTSGRYHSSWLSMMYPRLLLARRLLKEDGVIFVSIDDHEAENLRILMNEVFGEEAFVAQLIWKSRQNKDNRNVTGVSIDHEYILCYGQSVRGSARKLEQYSNPDADPRGDWVSGNMVGLLPQELRPNCHYDLINPETGINYGKPKLGWRYDKNTMARLIEENRILWPAKSSGRPRRKSFLSELKQEFTGYSSIVGEGVYTRNGTAEIDKLFGDRVIEFPKPVSLLKELIEQGMGDQDLIVDFFAGSGSTAQAVLEANRSDGGNRSFLLVQIPEPCAADSRASKKGLKTIAEIAKQRIRLVVKKIIAEKNGKLGLEERQLPEDLGFRVYKLAESNLKQWPRPITGETSPEQYQAALEEFADPLQKGAAPEAVIWEIALREGFGLSSEVTKIDGLAGANVYRVSALRELDDPAGGERKEFMQSFYISLDEKFNLDTAHKLKLERKREDGSDGDKLILRDAALDDTTAANLAQQCILKRI